MSEQLQNLDPAEINKFEQLADDWWDPTGNLKTLHVINPVRLNYIRDRTSLSDRSVLDIGCGGGLLTEALARCGAEVTGLDANESAILVARQHAEDENLRINYLHDTVESFSQKSSEQFDIITCMELLEHVPDPSALVQSCSGLLKKGGNLFLATINRNAKAYTTVILGAEYLLGLLPRGTHDYAKFIKPSELSEWLRKSGFQVSDISGMHYIPLADRCILNSDPSVNYLMHAQNNLR